MGMYRHIGKRTGRKTSADEDMNIHICILYILYIIEKCTLYLYTYYIYRDRQIDR